nr:bifunctional 4-hydroxy-2-oxoglutarate aldolase/2-dehydro-3-deoxy-phosphogluconate aldolase [Fredinandcohnia onubensis]
MKKEIQRITENKIIAVIRNIPEGKVLKVMEALLLGGIKTMEVTFGSPNTVGVIKKASEVFKDDLLIGAGTVLTVTEVDQAVEAGAKFIFSPNFSDNVVKRTLQHNVISIPGVMTPSEIYQAHEAGADAVKLFPAKIVGASFIKDIKGPMPFVNFIPTGGIDKNNITDFLKAGSIAVGMGGSLLDKQMITEGNYKQLTQHVKEIMKIASNFQ